MANTSSIKAEELKFYIKKDRKLYPRPQEIVLNRL